MSSDAFDWFVASAPGLEAITAGELRDLRLLRPLPEPGGVGFRGTLVAGLRANLWLRTGSRVLLRLGRFRVRRLEALEREAARLDWATWLPQGEAVRVRAHCARSRIYHSGAAAERVAAGLARSLGLAVVATRADGVILAPPGASVEAVARIFKASPGPVAEAGERLQTQRVQVRIFRDEVTVSLDASGQLLHRRGYRLETAKAPVRETVAAALLRAAGWRGDRPLWDPLAGSGTLVIEAALLAARRAPGRDRSFAMERWPRLQADARARLDAEADARLRPVTVSLVGSDRDAGAVAAAQRNAERAGVAEWVTFRRSPVSGCRLGSPPGLLVANPPYGRRMGRSDRLADLYAALGNLLRRSPAGWSLALVTNAPRLARATGLSLERLAPPVSAGGLVLHLLGGTPGPGRLAPL